MAEFTISSEVIGRETLKQIEDPRLQQAFKQAVNAGAKILFAKETHNLIVDQIDPNDQVPVADELGHGLVKFMLFLHSQSKGTMPGEIIPAVAQVLLAKVMEYIHDSGMEEVTDDDFAEALKLFVVGLTDAVNPQMRESLGLQPKEQPVESPPEEDLAMPQEEQTGLLNITGGV